MEPPVCPARTTTTPYSYAERLLGDKIPRGVSLVLGLRWSFGLPPLDGPPRLAEYSLPLNPRPILDALADRGPVRIRSHEGDASTSLYDHLATGEAAIVAIDAFHLPFRPAYRRIHSARTALAVAAPGGRIRVRDGWKPAAEGILTRQELDRCRNSDVPLDVEREPLFAGNPIRGHWLSVDAEPLRLDQPVDWARERLALLYDEMSTPRSDGRGTYGLAAFERFVQWVEERSAGAATDQEQVDARRAACLLLRPELSSRLYAGVFFRNAAHFLGDDELADEVQSYRCGLGYMQAAMDVLAKTVRTRRPEYDRFILEQLTAALRNEERLLAVLADRLADSPVRSAPSGVAGG